MDLNLVVLCGRLTAVPELRVFESGSRLLRLLLTVRSETPRRRTDVVPVALWDPPEHLLEPELGPGTWLWVAGMVQRRFWEDASAGTRRSRLEIVAEQVTIRESEELPAQAQAV